jgi:ABC-2 type transport system permease protein
MHEPKSSCACSTVPVKRPGRLYWIGFTTFVIRAFKDVVRSFVMTIAPPAINTALYLVEFGAVIGQSIGNIGGFPYQQYIAPGLILMPVIMSSYSQAGLSFVVAKLYRILDEHLVSPQPSWLIVVSYVAGGSTRGALVGIAAGVIALLFTHVEHACMALGILLFSATVSSLAGLINGILAKTLDQVNWVSSFVLTPLTYLGGIFYSLSSLPAWAQKLSLANPIFYLVDLFRYSMLGISETRVCMSITVILLVAISMFAVAVVLLQKGVGIRD